MDYLTPVGYPYGECEGEWKSIETFLQTFQLCDSPAHGLDNILHLSLSVSTSYYTQKKYLLGHVSVC